VFITNEQIRTICGLNTGLLQSKFMVHILTTSS